MRFSYHTHHDNKSPWLDEIPAHRILKDGYAYWPIRISHEDARQRGIKHGDIVKLYNDRGAILGVAWLTERVKRGTILTYQAGRSTIRSSQGNREASTAEDAQTC